MSKKQDYKLLILKLFPGVQNLRFKLQRSLKSAGIFLRYLPGSSRWIGPPRGFYTSAAAYNVQQKDTRLHIQEFNIQASGHCARVLPTTNSTLVMEKFSKCLTATLIEKKGFILHNARYLNGNGGTIITSDDKIFIPASPLKNEWYPQRHQSLYLLKLPPLTRLDKVILLDTVAAESNYGHWMMDHLPRLYWLTKMNLDLSEYTLLTVNWNTTYQNDTHTALKSNGFGFKEQITILPKQHILCNELVIPPYCTNDFCQDGISRDQKEIRFVENLFLDKPNLVPTGPKRIYLSRRKSIRTFAGEAELVAMLGRYNIQEFFLEDITVWQQAVLFNDAELIIGLHGSGFTNLYFCNAHTKVVEIYGANFIVTDFWSIGNQKQLNYYCYCDDHYKKEITNYRVARNEAVNVDIDSFVSFLKSHTLIS